MLHTTFVILVYSNQCIIQDNCRHGPDTDFQNISREENLSGQSVSGDSFVPYEEKCRITWSTIVVWVLLIMSTAGQNGFNLILLGKGKGPGEQYTRVRSL